MSTATEVRPTMVGLHSDTPKTFVNTTWKTPPSQWTPMIHPREAEVTREVDGYFLEHWPFPDEKAREKFIKTGFSKVTCLYAPLAKDDRIHFACRLLTVLFLVDDLLEDMSLADGEKLNNRLIELSKGPEYATPDRSIPVEYIIYDLWESMRLHDRALADEVLPPTFMFMRSQTDRARLTIRELGDYLEYRAKDVGTALLAALMRFCMEIPYTALDLKIMGPLEEVCAKHISVVNDIYSFEKEVLASETGHVEGAFLCSAVKVVSTQTGLDVEATKRVLWSMVREWELVNDKMCEELQRSGVVNQAASEYMRGLQLQMSGNEAWSKTTVRYMEPTAPAGGM